MPIPKEMGSPKTQTGKVEPFSSIVAAKLSELEVDLVQAYNQLANEREESLRNENKDLRTEVQTLRHSLRMASPRSDRTPRELQPTKPTINPVLQPSPPCPTIPDPSLPASEMVALPMPDAPNYISSTTSIFRERSIMKEEFELYPELLEEEYADDEAVGSDLGYVTRQEHQLQDMSVDKHCIIDPLSWKRLIWDLFGIPVLAYDLITIPLQAFDNDSFHDLAGVVDWITLLYWTLDFVLTFATGYLDREGNVIMQHQRIAHRYLRGTFALDLTIMLSDWATQGMKILEADSSGAHHSVVSNLSVLRVLRISRFMRLARLRKLKARFQEIEDFMSSEWCLVMMHLLLQIGAILIINHYIACGWYWLGSSDWPGPPEERWLNVYRHPLIGDAKTYLSDASFAYKYSTCLHWAIAQFTPGPQNIQAQNTWERLYMVFVLLFGLIVFSSFIAAVTQARLQMTKMMSKLDKDFWLLRKFCKEHGISQNLQTRMKRYIDMVVIPAEHRLDKADCSLINKLSPKLQDQLHAEISAHVFEAHPLFVQLQRTNQTATTRLYSRALLEMPLARGDVAFVGGEKASHMFMVTFGCLDYIPVVSKYKEKHVSGGQWASEAALWTKWVHQGQLQASVESKTVTIKDVKFRKVMIESALVIDFARFYGKAFCRCLNKVLQESGMPSDLCHKFCKDCFAQFTQLNGISDQ